MFIKKKKAIVISLALTMMASLVGCGQKKYGKLDEKGACSSEEIDANKAMKIGDYEIYINELAMYAMQTAYLQGVTSSALTDADIKACKDTAVSLVRTNRIMYDVATKNGCELAESDTEYVNNMITGFKGKFAQDILDKYGITDELINRVFTEQAVVSKFKNDQKNELGQYLQGEVEKEYEGVKFHTVYYMLFPIVEIENGSPKLDETGNYIYLNDEDKNEVLANATEASERISDGENYLDLVTEYGIEAYSTERPGYVGAYSDEEVDEKISNLKNGECLEPFEDTLGYVVVVMVNSDDQATRDSYISYIVSENVSAQYSDLEKEWLNSIPVDDATDMIGTIWADFDFTTMVKDMETLGIVKLQ